MEAKDILDNLKPMFVEARAKKLWFHCASRNIWFSPDELEEEQKQGLFIWGSVNWKLRDPNEYLKYLEDELERKKQDINNLKKRIEEKNPDPDECEDLTQRMKARQIT